MRLAPSLFRHLLAWALGSLVVVWATFVFFGWQTGVHEADELTDGHLASVASLLLTQNVTAFAPAPNAAALGGAPQLRAHDYQQSLSVFVWDAGGKLVARTGEAPTPPFSAAEGFETLALGTPPVHWRAFSRWDGPAHARRISVMLSVAERDGLAEDIAEQVVMPGLWLLPAVALLLVLAIRRGLRPLDELGRSVHLLDIHRDTELRGPPHAEFKGIVQAVNMLIQRYNAALARERELASEVAHELRTPLASIALHASTLEGDAPDADRQAAVQRIKDDAARAGGVITDLLALARASRAELAEAARPVDLAALARAVVAEYADRTFASGHELGLDADEDFMVDGHAVLLQIALRNLIDNAIRHTPRGTRIDVTVWAAPPALEVSDNGPAMSAPDTARAASVGHGLGHQVVAKIAAVHHGRFEMDEAAADGLRRYRIVLGNLP